MGPEPCSSAEATGTGAGRVAGVVGIAVAHTESLLGHRPFLPLLSGSRGGGQEGVLVSE